MFSFCSDSKIVIAAGFLFTILNGFAFPSLGIILAKMMVIWLKYQEGLAIDIDSVKKWYLIAAGIALLSGFFVSLSKLLFGILGNKVIQKIRMQALEKIIRMPISWHDNQNNSP
jgi:ABC-type multidrug transport system fused ATPase/permease subunit